MNITVRYFGYNEAGLHSCAVFKGDVLDGDGEYLEGDSRELTRKVKGTIRRMSGGKDVTMVSQKHQETIFRVG
jgi:hypothetical protein